MAQEPRFRRVLLKISGEALMGAEDFGIAPATMRRIAGDIAEGRALGVEVAIVIGGGNIFRGVNSSKIGVQRVAGDHMGMLATVINALALRSALEHTGVEVRVQSAIPMHTVCEQFIRERAERHLRRGRVLVLAGGTGNPYYTTDSAAVLRASELGCDIVFKATKVDGVYSADPEQTPDAQRYDTLTYKQVLERDLKVMDATAVAQARDNGIPILVFSLHNAGSFARALTGREASTVIR
ncbi:MAG: UMP kinase [Alphaproteobacteria bacterium]|nr:UMP kinase [Alphaproteobacteria bacterium]MCY4320641.1 UMP kinase [Alphaproteobacteria bacterium]